MVGSIQFRVKVPFDLKQEGGWYIASCCLLDVHSQGHTDDQAVRNLIEAIQLFLETCYELGTLEQILKDCGFHAASKKAPPESGNERMLDIPFPALIANKKNAEACAH